DLCFQRLDVEFVVRRASCFQREPADLVGEDHDGVLAAARHFLNRELSRLDLDRKPLGACDHLSRWILEPDRDLAILAEYGGGYRETLASLEGDWQLRRVAAENTTRGPRVVLEHFEFALEFLPEFDLAA